MLDFLFLIIFICLPIALFYLLKLAGERINQVSIVNITTVALYFFSVLGVFVLYFQLDEYRYNTGVIDKFLVSQVLLYSCINILFFLFGVLAVRKIIGVDVVPFEVDKIQFLSSLQNMILMFLFLFCCLILVYYLSYVDRIAIAVALTDGTRDEVNQARSNMGNAFPGKYHWFKLIMYDLGSVLTFTCFAMLLIKKSKLLMICFFIVASYSIFVAVMATEKGPLAWLMIGLFMTYFLVRNGGYIPFKKLIPFVLLLISALIALYIYFMGSRDVSAALWSVFSRAFSGSISPAYFYLEYFPEHQDFLLGRTFPNPGAIFPYTPYKYTIEIMNWKFPELASKGVVGSAPTVFWGEAYINFGVLGVPVVACMMGCFIAFISYLVSKLQVNPLTIGFLVWLILIIKNLSVTGFSGYFYNIYIICISLLVILVVSLRSTQAKNTA